jgi:hypothetical protein
MSLRSERLPITAATSRRDDGLLKGRSMSSSHQCALLTHSSQKCTA